MQSVSSINIPDQRLFDPGVLMRTTTRASRRKYSYAFKRAQIALAKGSPAEQGAERTAPHASKNYKFRSTCSCACATPAATSIESRGAQRRWTMDHWLEKKPPSNLESLSLNIDDEDARAAPRRRQALVSIRWSVPPASSPPLIRTRT